MPENVHARVERERTEAFPKPDEVNVYRRYAEGKQINTLGAEQRRHLGQVTKNDHADNIMDTVLSTGASRVVFEGFEVADADVQAALDDLVVRNAMLEMQFDIHYAALRDGNHAVGLHWQPDAKPIADPRDGEAPSNLPTGRVVVSHEPWWNGKEGVFVAYEEDGRTPAYAVKDWNPWMDVGGVVRRRQRRVIWWPNRIERYIRDGAGWIPYQLPEDNGTWPIDWTKRDGSPLGVPIVHFPNVRFGKTPYGMSDLAGGLLGMQDELNDLQRDLTAAARLTAYQMYYVTGHDLEDQPIAVAPGAMLYSENENAKFGVFTAGALDQIIKGIGTKVQTISRGSQTPQHLITGGDWPSGEALIRAESPLEDRANRIIRSFSPSYATVGHRSTEIINAYGRGALNETVLIRARFEPAQRRDELTLQEVEGKQIDNLIALRELGWSLDALQAMYGLSEAERTAMAAQRKKEIEDAGELMPQSGERQDEPEPET